MNWPEASLADPDDPAEAAARLEHALERIAALASRVETTPPSESRDHSAERAEPPAADTAEVAARLDALIAQLRTVLASRSGS